MRYGVRYIHCVKAAMCLALACMGNSSGAANLGEVLQWARANDPQLAAAQQAARVGAEKAEQGRAGLRPNINVNVALRGNQDRLGGIDTPRSYGTEAYTLTMTQPVFRPANTAAKRQGELQAEQAQQQLRIAEQDLLLRVAKGYFDVLQASDALETVRAQKAAFTQQLAQAVRSLEVGTVPITDVNEARSRHDLTLAQEVVAMNDLDLKRNTLEKIIHRNLPPLARLAPDASVDRLNADQLEDLLARAAFESLQVQVAESARAIAREEASRQQAGHSPTVDVVGSWSYNRNANHATLGENQTANSSIGLEATVPLYQGGAVDSRVREAAANLIKADAELEAARRQARLDARQAQLGVRSGLALTTALTQALASAEAQLRSTQRGFEVGTRTRLDVLNAQQQMFVTKRDLASARYQLLSAGLQLKAAAGALAETDLRALDALLVD